jgi:hypothetical protein
MAGPEQGMEIDNVFADEVVQLCGTAFLPGLFPVQHVLFAVIAPAGNVADRCIYPHIKILAGGVRNFKAEIRRITGNVPVVQAGIKPFIQFVGHFTLQASRFFAVFQKAGKIRKLEEVMIGLFHHRSGAGNGGVGLFQFGGGIGGAANLTRVAVLVFGAALGALALDEAVGQEHLLFRIEQLTYGAGSDMSGITIFHVNFGRQFAVFFRVRGMIIVEADVEVGKVTLVVGFYRSNLLFRADAVLLSLQHDGGTVSIVCADVVHVMATGFLKANPDIGLDVFHQMAKVNRAVGIGQGAGDKDAPLMGVLAHDSVNIVTGKGVIIPENQ